MEFDRWICNPIQLLINTTSKEQEQNKRADIEKESATKQELSIIAREIRELDKPHFKDVAFVREMSTILTEELSLIRENFKEQLQQLSGLVAEKLKPLYPFSKNVEEDIYQRIAKRREQDLKEEQQMIQEREERKVSGLSKLGKFIGPKDSLVTFEEWLKMGKRIDEI